MLQVYTQHIVNRLTQLVNEIQGACDYGIDYYDRLREFKRYCDDTPALAQFIDQLPKKPFPFLSDWREMANQWPNDEATYGARWDGIKQVVDGDPDRRDDFWISFAPRQPEGLRKMTEVLVIPLCNFLLYHLESSSATLYLLSRFKGWAEWFEADNLRTLYEANVSKGEAVLDRNLRRFLFESGVDYPFSQPASPDGKVDVIAGLETTDPLILEIKVWDSSRGYRENRLRDGLSQVMDYAAKYRKDRGYVVVFNLDTEPLSFVSQTKKGEWPPSIEHGGRTYFFIDVHIAEKPTPISHQAKGKPVQVHEINLTDLLNTILND